ncbi:MAG: hypothetical protein Q9162_005674 [Coniocarpon cinnabarinum]
MHHYTPTPWKSPSDLLDLRTLLFGSTVTSTELSSQNSRRRALALIHAYKLRRANLPKAVECTALLVDALLSDQPDDEASSDEISPSDEDNAHEENDGSDGSGSPDVDVTADESTSIVEKHRDSTESTKMSARPSNRRKRKRHTHPHQTPFTTSLALSHAFEHFITSYCDTPSPSIPRKVSMLDAARLVGMPDLFVAWRHEIAHRERVSTGRLRVMCFKGVKWLRVRYWDRLEEDVGMKAYLSVTREARMVHGASATRDARDARDGTNVDGSEVELEVRQDVERILSDFRRRRLREVKDQQTQDLIANSVRDAASALIKTTATTKSPSSKITAALVDTLMREKMLIPHRPQPGLSMSGAFRLWDQLLRISARLYSGFVMALLERLASCLNDVREGFAEACEMWIWHVVEDEEWSVVFAKMGTGVEDVREVLMDGLVREGLSGRRSQVWERLVMQSDSEGRDGS